MPTIVEDWDIPDPAGKSVDEVRAIRDQIELRVRDLLEHRIDADPQPTAPPTSSGSRTCCPA